ncbi:MAG: NAD(P)/FAD-dependent oxidoreductase [Janthinobacterium lividum]
MARIVVVGGGIAGVVVATHLARRLPAAEAAEVLLVDQNPAHVWKPMLHTFAAGTSVYANEAISFAVQAARSGFRFWPGVLAGLDRARRVVRLGPVRLPDGTDMLAGREVAYDTLVLAVGSRADDFGTPGVAEHCRFIDEIREAERFNDVLRSRLMQGVDAGRDVGVVIVGGGATGVELAAELRRHMDILGGYAAGGTRTALRLTLVEAGPRLLPAFPERISGQALQVLRGLGVDVRVGTKVVGADAGGVVLEGGRVDAALSVWAAGVRAPRVVAELDGLAVGRHGQVVVGPTLQSVTDPEVFALGDCASLAGADGRPLPATAQVARQQAVFLARSLAARARRGRALRAFAFRDMGSVVSLGDYAAYGTLGSYGVFRGGFLPGRVAQLSHAALYRMHQMDLQGVVRGGIGWLADDLGRMARPGVRLD